MDSQFFVIIAMLNSKRVLQNDNSPFATLLKHWWTNWRFIDEPFYLANHEIMDGCEEIMTCKEQDNLSDFKGKRTKYKFGDKVHYFNHNCIFLGYTLWGYVLASQDIPTSFRLGHGTVEFEQVKKGWVKK